ncbi:MAG TPA: thiol:disulfide interchange protein DsbA/DsbL [Spongiibacteraceae bacterium]|nr:thiol:disulfide interchange protein DsbA/DsbL [Spongiibacteraceae bacterium]
MIRSLVITAVLALLIPFTAHAQTAAPAFKEGVHYFLLADPVRPRDPKKIEVVEVFQYGCPHCFRFEPLIKAWQKTLASDVDFYHLPVVWNAPGQLHAQAFYAAQALGVLDSKMHDALFDAIHVQNNQLNTKELIAKLFAANGVSADQFNNAFDSFGVTSQVNQAKARTLSYKIDGTPELIVAGKYRIDGKSFGGPNVSERDSHQKMLEVANFLIAKERPIKIAK